MVPYGIELRERVMRAWDSGELQADVAERFEVSMRWIQQLARLRRETGCLAPKRATGGAPGSSPGRSGGTFARNLCRSSRRHTR